MSQYDMRGWPIGGGPEVREVRRYASRRSAEQYARRHGLTIVESLPDDHRYPARDDAFGWDLLRTWGAWSAQYRQHMKGAR